MKIRGLSPIQLRPWCHFLLKLAISSLLAIEPSLALAGDSKTGPQPMAPEAADSVYFDLLASVYPSVSGAKTLFKELNENPALRAHINKMIESSPELLARAKEGLEFREAYYDQLRQGLNDEAVEVAENPLEAAIASLRKFQVAGFEMGFKPLPEWQIQRDAWNETVQQFGLSPQLTVSQLEQIQSQNELYQRAYAFYKDLRRRKEFLDTPGMTASQRRDPSTWRRYMIGLIQHVRENNIRQALTLSAGYSNPNFRADYLGQDETRAQYISAVGSLDYIFLDSLRVHLSADDLRHARIWIAPPGDPEARKHNVQELQGTRFPKPSIMLRKLFLGLFSLQKYFNLLYFKLPAKTMRSAYRPVQRRTMLKVQTNAQIANSESDYVIIAFDRKKLSPEAYEKLHSTGFTIKVSIKDFTEKFLDKLFVDSSLHYESAKSMEKRIVSEASIRDLSLGTLQAYLRQDDTEEVKPLLKALETKSQELNDAMAIASDYPDTLSDQARAEYHLEERTQNDLVSGIKWWGHRAFPAYWSARDAVAWKYKRPNYKTVLAGEVKPISNIIGKPISRLTSHYRTGSKFKRSLITAGLYGLMFLFAAAASNPDVQDAAKSAPGRVSEALASDSVRNTLNKVGETVGKFGDRLSSTLKGWTSSDSKSKEAYEDENGANPDAKKIPLRPDTSYPSISDYKAPQTVPMEIARNDSAEARNAFHLEAGAGNASSYPYFVSFAGSFSTNENIAYSNSERLDKTNLSNFPISPSYYIVSDKPVDFYSPRMVHDPFPIPMAPGHQLITVEYRSSTYGYWSQLQSIDRSNVAASEVNGYTFIKVSGAQGLGPVYLRFGYLSSSRTESSFGQLNLRILSQVNEDLKSEGFIKIANAVEDLIRNVNVYKPDSDGHVYISDLEEVFAKSSEFSYDEPDSLHGDSQNPFYLETSRLKNGVYFTQSDGAHELLSTFLKEYFRRSGHTVIHVEPLHGFVLSQKDPFAFRTDVTYTTTRVALSGWPSWASYDSTPKESTRFLTSKYNNPFQEREHKGPPPVDADHQPWNRRRRSDQWLDLVTGARQSIDHLRDYLGDEKRFADKTVALGKSIDEFEAKIAALNLPNGEILQSPAAGLFKAIPHLVAFRENHLDLQTLKNQLLRSFSPFVTIGVEPKSIQDIIQDFQTITKAYFAKINEWDLKSPSHLVGIQSHADPKFQAATLELTSELLSTSWTLKEYKPISTNCESILTTQPDHEQ